MAHSLDSSKKADVLIVGGGIIGSAIALRLARSGVSVTVIDRSLPCSEASGAAAGMIAPQGEMIEPESFSEFCTASRDLYPEFAAEVEELAGESVHYRNDGTLLVAIDGEECEELEHVYRTQTQRGLPLERLADDNILKRLPALSPRIKLALFVPGDHRVDNERLTRGLIKAGELSGATFHWNCAVTGFNIQDDQIESVRVAPQGSTAESTLSAERFVLAAGCWSGQVEGVPPDAHAPVRPVKGQTLRLRLPGRPRLGRVVRAAIKGSPVYLVPRGDGAIVVGASVEERGFDQQPRAGAVYELLRDAQSVLPELGEAVLDEVSTGLRPGSPDNAPLVGPTPVDGLIHATGHYRNGILLTPVTADGIAALIADGALPEVLVPFSPS
ncbi:MAG TPA: glycine oxidase ThiO, partial [Terriglobia bacterium]|nr:glycine oxidase ThiO [Terriglobia bacterium]